MGLIPYYSDNLITLYNGDCLEIISDLSLNNFKFDVVITDPPYGVLPTGKGEYKFEWDNVKIKEFTETWFPLLTSVLNKNNLNFIFWSQKYLNMGINIFKPNRLIMWRYDNLINGGNGDFAYDYDPIFFVRTGNKKINSGKHSCDLQYTKPQSNFKLDKLVHPTQKPIKLMLRLVELSTQPDDVILDPFCGSGTTLIASKLKGIRSVGIEKNKEYCELAVERIKNINQKKLF